MLEIKDIVVIGGPALLGLLFFFLFVLMDEYIFLILGISFVLIFLINGIYQVIQENKPSLTSLEKINQLKKYFEDEQIKEYIRHLYHEQQQSIHKIAWKVEKEYKVELHYKKGHAHGDLKPGVYEKIKEILGYDDIDLFWEK
jgi:hypothetical protein